MNDNTLPDVEGPFYLSDEEDAEGNINFNSQRVGRGEVHFPILPRCSSSNLQPGPELETGAFYSLAPMLNDPYSPTPSPLKSLWDDTAPEPFILPPCPTEYTNTPANLADLEKYSYTLGKFLRRHRITTTSVSTKIKKQDREACKKEFIECMKKIPKEYRTEEFQVMKCSELQRAVSDVSQGTITLNKLSHYLDLVEVNLLRQIHLRSESFFTAMLNIKEIHIEVETICRSIALIRAKMADLEKSLVAASVNVWGTKKRRRLRSLVSLLEMIHTARNSQTVVRNLIDLGDYFSAIKVIKETFVLMKTKLKGVRCLQNTEERLGQDLILVGKLLQTDFVQLAIIIPAIKSSSVDKLAPDSSSKDDRLARVIEALHSISDFKLLPKQLQKAFRELAVDKIKTCLSKSLSALELAKTIDSAEVARGQSQAQNTELQQDEPAESLEKGAASIEPHYLTNSSSTTSLGPDIVALSHMDFMTLSEPLFSLILRIASRVRKVEILSRTVLKADELDPAKDVEASGFLKEMKAVVSGSCEYFLSRVGKILELRTTQHANLTFKHLRALFSKCLEFIAKVEEIACSKFYDIRNSLLQQTKRFLDRFHETRVDQLVQRLNEEKWDTVKIPMKYQHILDTGFEPPKEGEVLAYKSSIYWWRQGWDEPEVELVAKTNGHLLEAFILTTTDGIEERFRIVPSLLTLLSLVQEYVECAVQLQPIGTNVVEKLVSLVTTYNSRSCELILGAGAMHQVGLKRIQAKHLCLSSRCVYLLVQIIPRIENVLVDKLPRMQRSLIQQSLSRMVKDLRKHREQILKKIVSIIEKLAIQLVGEQLLSMSWNEEKPTPEAEREESLNLRPDEPVSKLMKHTKQLHKVLTNYLGPNQRDLLFKDIAQSLVSSLVDSIKNLDFENSVIHHRVRVNVKFIIDRLERLECLTEAIQAQVKPYLRSS